MLVAPAATNDGQARVRPIVGHADEQSSRTAHGHHHDPAAGKPGSAVHERISHEFRREQHGRVGTRFVAHRPGDEPPGIADILG
jgi:hypothetical protein